jgi:hypothetical protein
MNLSCLPYEIKLKIIDFIPLTKQIVDNPPPIFHDYIISFTYNICFLFLVLLFFHKVILVYLSIKYFLFYRFPPLIKQFFDSL